MDEYSQILAVALHLKLSMCVVGSGVATLSDYQSSRHDTPGDDDDSEKFFAGGSEHR